ncbi:MAG: SprT-like domain-containing protein [Lentihominibacter sp.]
MNIEKLNEVLKEVIQEARNLKIPVPFTISEQIKVNPRPKKRFGCCRKKGDRFVIEISEFILKCADDKIRGVIAHEVLHTCEGCYEHGSLWKKYASQMNSAYGYNIKRTSSFEEMGIQHDTSEDTSRIKYIIKCEKCGREYPRQRYTCVMQKIKAYRCSCGGRLYVITLNSDKGTR